MFVGLVFINVVYDKELAKGPNTLTLLLTARATPQDKPELTAEGFTHLHMVTVAPMVPLPMVPLAMVPMVLVAPSLLVIPMVPLLIVPVASMVLRDVLMRLLLMC